MNEKRDNSSAKRDDFTLTQPGSLLDAALARLPKEQQERLLNKALEHRLDIEVETAKADLRDRNSSWEMEKTIRQIKSVEQSTRSDYSIRAEYETASGKTNLEVKRSTNTVIIVIAVVIGIIVLMMFG